ncbi:hypothetical protein KJ656_03275 [bacterium]|nr:hypothetical protein [bacterium]
MLDNKKNVFLIPPELNEIEISKIFLFLQSEKSNLLISYKKLISNFKTLGNISNKSLYELELYRGIGKKALFYLRKWYDGLFVGKFKDMPILLSNTIKCSPLCHEFLLKHDIKKIDELTRLDMIPLEEHTYDDKLAILELRTLYYSKKNHVITSKINTFKSKNINLIRDIDCYLSGNYISDFEKQIAQCRYNINNGKTSLKEVGELFNLTGERVRQILRDKIIAPYSTFFIINHQYYHRYFLNLIKNTLKPIEFSDISSLEYNCEFQSNLYLGFLSDVFENIPFVNFLPFEQNSDVLKINSTLFKKAKVPYNLDFFNYIQNMTVNNQLLHFLSVFSSKRLILNDKNNTTYLNKRHYNFHECAMYILKNSVKPISINDIYKQLSNLPLNNKERLKMVFARPIKRKSMFAYMLRYKDIFRIDRHLWGLEKHLSYPRELWFELQEFCQNELKNIGHQMHVRDLYLKAIKKFPKLNSKYELAEILKRDNNIQNLGFYTYNLASTGQNVRLTLEKTVRTIFNINKNPIHGNKLYQEIIKHRSCRLQSLRTLAKQLDILKIYRPNYFGLIEYDNFNKEYLSRNINFLLSYVKYRKKDATLISDIIDELETDLSQLDFINIIKTIPDIIIAESEDPVNATYIIYKKWSIKRVIITILASTKKSYSCDELQILIKSITNKSFKPAKIRYEVENDIRITKMNDGSYKYNSISGDFKPATIYRD